MCRVYDIVYDKYYPAAPTEIIIDLNKHPENIDIKDLIKNITGYYPNSYKIYYSFK